MSQLGGFIASSRPPDAARAAAARAVLDTIGVTLAGSTEPAARAVQRAMTAESRRVPCDARCRVVGVSMCGSASEAALANGTAAHALDFDDMCFVSLAHPSAPLVSAALAAAELEAASGSALLDAYIVGFELEARLGRAMNPRHYRRGWHCTSTLGTIGAAAAVCRLLATGDAAAMEALSIAASEASGLKENFGTMVKPLHAGLAARNGVLAGLLARAGMTASRAALDGPQGLLAAMDSESASLEPYVTDLGERWEIVETGITVKLYPSCAATHPALDVLLDLRRREGVDADAVDSVLIGVDPVTPTVLIYDRPASGLEGKFSMAYCAAAALVHGRLGIESFDEAALRDLRVAALQGRVHMTVDPLLDASAPPLTQASVKILLRGGREIVATASGARGYPDRPASDGELADKFLSCAAPVLGDAQARDALDALRGISRCTDVRDVTAFVGGPARTPASTP